MVLEGVDKIKGQAIMLGGYLIDGWNWQFGQVCDGAYVTELGDGRT